MAVTLTTGGLYNVEYIEYADGYGEAWQPDAVSCTRLCAVAWANRYRFVLDMVGWTSRTLDPNTGRLVRQLPQQHPWFPGMYVRSCVLRDRQGIPAQDALGRINIDQRNANGSEASPSDGSGLAVYEVQYHRPNYFIKADGDILKELDRYVIRNAKPAQQTLSLPSQAFKFDSVANGVPVSIAGKAAPGDITRPFGTLQLTMDWLMVPVPPWSVIQAQLGRVNAISFDTDYGNWPAETLLFESAEVVPKQHASSDFLYDIRYVFTFREQTWNKFYSRVENDFYKLVAANGTGFPPFRNDGDFNALFYS